jgi:type II restriction/modification system DNA methylase subunit YeeA
MTETIDRKDYNIDFERIRELVSKYEQIKNSGEIKKYNEESTKKDFILPLFEALGWNVYNKGNKDNSVSAEETISKKRVDYGFRINGIPQFFLEAKSLKEDDIQNNPKYVTQAIDYAWMKSCSWAILTNFETIAVYNADWKSSTPNGNVLFVFHPDDFLTNDRFKMLSKKAFERDELDKEATNWGKKQFKNRIDKQLLLDMIRFREILSKDIMKNNQDKHLTQEDIDESVQRILDRLIFIRNAEDRGLEENQLQSNVRQWYSRGKGHLLKEISRIYADYDKNYNSKLFAHHLCDDLYIENEALKEVIEGLNQSKDNSYRYDFSIIESDVLGNIYEQYLGNILKSTPKRAKLEESKTHRKEQGIYYTPSYIVDYIVKNSVGEFIKTHTPEEIKKVRILDPACGSGSFLIRAYKELENYWLHNSDFAQTTLESEEFYSKKVEILKNNIFGVDLDPKAVEIAQLNLLLQISERKQRLPILQNNIKVGNSLIDDSSISDRAFKWEEEFPEIMKEGGFDIVIGNPPYIPIEEFPDADKTYYFKNYKSAFRKFDTSILFIERSSILIKNQGILGFITPQTWQTGDNYSKFRSILFSSYNLKRLVNLPFDVFQNAYIDTGIVILSKGKLKNSEYLAYSYGKKEQIQSVNILEYHRIEQNYIDNDPEKKVYTNKFIYLLFRKLQENSVPLGMITDSCQGIVVSKFPRSDYKINEFYKKLLISGSGDRYSFLIKKIGYIDYSKAMNLYKYYSQPRIFVRRIINRKNRLMAFYCDEQLITTKDYNPFIIKNTSYDLFYILALLNSKLFSFIYTLSSSLALKDDFRQTTLAELRKLPIKKVNEEQKQLNNLSFRMTDLNKKLINFKNTDSNKKFEIEEAIKRTDREIDDVVYRIYGITDSEKKIIESAFTG